MCVGDDGQANRTLANAPNRAGHCFGVAIGHTRIDDNNAFRCDDKARIADAATIGRRDIAHVTDKRVNVLGDPNRIRRRGVR